MQELDNKHTMECSTATKHPASHMFQRKLLMAQAICMMASFNCNYQNPFTFLFLMPI